MIKVFFSGLSTAGTGRVWGYLYDSTQPNYSWGLEYHTFWGHKDGRLFFRACINDSDFNKMKFKKIKKYTPVDLDDKIKSEFEQLKILNKLKGY